MTKAAVWITFIFFTLSSSGCYSLFEGRDYPARAAHADEKRTTSFKAGIARVGEQVGMACEHAGRVCLELGKVCLEIVIVAAVILAYAAASSSHGCYGYPYHGYHH